jgi:hypothetical protein
MSQTAKGKDLARHRKERFRHLVASNSTYPLATITYHGPSPDRATKIVVGVLADRQRKPIVREWTGPNIAEDVGAAREIAEFIKGHDVARVLTSEWVLSCPHEEGVDYPVGESCPYCPDWN